MSYTEQWAGLFKMCENAGVFYEADAPLSPRCSFKIGGRAGCIAEPTGEGEIKMLLAAAKEEGIPLLVLGKGSNVLFADEGYAGLVVVLGPRFSRITLEGDGVVFCESGASLTQLCRFALEHGLAGLEFAYGIPGSVGGAVYMNAGAYGGEIKDVLLSARHLEPDGRFAQLPAQALELGYRHSVYTDSGRVITGARFRLRPGDPTEIRARMEDYMGRRRSKQPLEYPSAGSTFKRPAGDYASALIDRCGLKGCRVGGAMVSEKHAGFVINAGSATCADVLALIGRVQAKVKEKTGYDLECEVRIIR